MANLPVFSSADAQNLRERFLALKTRSGLADILGVAPSHMTYLLWGIPDKRRYRERTVPKRSGGQRNLLVPHPGLLLLQRRFLSLLYVVAPRARATAHGFVPGRGIRTNAARHVGRRFVFKADLVDFFPSINFGRVFGFWRGAPYGFSRVVASTLAELCCHQNQLPQGAPTSPHMANLICRPLDGALEDLAARHGCVYTRYADDITFSSNHQRFPPSIGSPSPHLNGVAKCGPGLVSAVRKAGFQINSRKCWLFSRAGRQLVTGLVVNEKVNPPRTRLRELRGIVRECERVGLEKTAESFKPTEGSRDLRAFLRGSFSFLADVQRDSPVVYNRLARRARKVAPDLGIRLLDEPRHPIEEAVAGRIWVVERDPGKGVQGTAFLLRGVGLVTCWHVVQEGSVIEIYRPESPRARRLVSVARHDADLDLAILEPSPSSAADGLRVAQTSSPRVLDEVSVVGCPQHKIGATPSIKLARVSGVVPHPASQSTRLTLDTGIVAGMSGGPVLDAKGDVIGIAVSGAPDEWDQRNADEYGVIRIGDLERLGLRR